MVSHLRSFVYSPQRFFFMSRIWEWFVPLITCRVISSLWWRLYLQPESWSLLVLAIFLQMSLLQIAGSGISEFGPCGEKLPL